MNNNNNNNNNNNGNNNKHRFSLFVIICLSVMLGIVLASIATGVVQYLLAGLLSCLTAIITALVTIFMLKHIMHFFESKILSKFLKNKTIIRIISLLLSICIVLGFVALLIYLFVPRTVNILNELLDNKETFIYQLKDEVTTMLSSLFGSNADEIVASISDTLYSYIEATFNTIIPAMIGQLTSVVSILGQVLLGLIVAFLYLFDREKVNAYIVRMAKVRINEEKLARTKYFLDKSDKILIDFVIAKALECVVITICLGVIMSIINVEAAFELAFLIGVLNVIPYIGFIIALIPLILVSLVYGSVSIMLQAVIFVTLAYIFLTTFVTPVIVGKRVKLNMIVMFLSLIVGGCMFGMVGMLLCVPVGALITEFIQEDVVHREQQAKQKVKETENKQSQNNAILLNSTANEITEKTKTKRKSKKVVVEVKEEQAQPVEEEMEEKSSQTSKKKKSFKDILTKIKDDFVNISPENSENEE